MSEQAEHAIRAAKQHKSWGRYATALFLRKRNVPFALYRLARQLESVK